MPDLQWLPKVNMSPDTGPAGWASPDPRARQQLIEARLLANSAVASIPAQHAIQVALAAIRASSLKFSAPAAARAARHRLDQAQRDPGGVRQTGGALWRASPARPRGSTTRRRRATSCRSAAVGEDPGHPGHRVQLARTGSSAPRRCHGPAIWRPPSRLGKSPLVSYRQRSSRRT